MSAVDLLDWGQPSFPHDVVVKEPTPIFPGERLVIEWTWRNPRWVTDVTVDVRIGDQLLIREKAPAPGSTLLIDPPADRGMAQLLYRIGAKVVTLTLLTDQGISVYGNCELLVKSPSIGDWWSWKWPNRDPVPWKAKYSIGGELMNAGLSSLRCLQATFREISPEGDDRPLSITPPDLEAPPNHPLRLEKESICQDWIWFKAWSPIYRKTFTYTLDLEIADEYGNRYLVRDRPPWLVNIQVSADKRKYGYLDVFLRGAAGGLTLGFSFLGQKAIKLAKQAWGAAGHNQATGALGAGKMAEDPPEPDYQFTDRVPIDDYESTPTGDWGDLAPIAEALTLIDRVISSAEALARIENKWLGAREQGEIEWVRIQRIDYLSLLARVSTSSDRILDLAATLSRMSVLPRDQVGPQLDQWHEEGVPADIVSSWFKYEVPLELSQLAASWAALRGARSWPEGGIGVLISNAALMARSIVNDLVRANPVSSTDEPSRSA